ncbi:phospholipase D family protein [Microbacterium limosum]|uniref:Phospholipase D family protein n=1 Tax=Microbacterium limosum TaxID=3079935 RepID=A0AAU0MF41_9MICO|nr:phospholipase D family protein [Microbacterium sp. Y20]WOQ68622.1 phospholipase D family protein [Microbacterium sp. Y20]
MLEPQTRAALTDMLHPPTGFALSHAVATTFTLDLDTALTIPLSFAAHRVTASDDPIGILDAVRRAADKVDIFAQAGQVGIEIPPSALVAFLEPMVHPVEVERGIFHPKVWFLEYERGDERAYRFVCASRNLTADRSWDVVISLDGSPAMPSDRAAAREINEPLVRLLRSLPKMSVRPVPGPRRARIDALATRIRDVAWTPPEGMRDIRFHVWGVGERPQPEFWGIRGLFISPFLTDAGLIELKKGAYGDAYLVSRGTSIDALAPATFDKKLRQAYVLDDAADIATEDDEQKARRSLLTGLHAKTYVFDRQDGAHVFLGSLNATGPALHENVEVMVEAVGKVKPFGVENTLEGLKEFLQEFEYTGGVEESENEKADRDLSAALRRIAGIRLHARVAHAESYELHVWRDGDVTVPREVELSWHPITRTGLAIPGLPGEQSAPSVVGDLGLTDITPFIIVTARDARGERFAQRTVVLAELHDDPVDRRDAVIAAHLTDRAAFMRFLMLLLELGGFALPGAGDGGSWQPISAGDGHATGLFEALMRAVGPDRTGLEEVQRVIDYMGRQPDGTSVLPEGFDALWASIWAAQQTVKKSRQHG